MFSLSLLVVAFFAAMSYRFLEFPKVDVRQLFLLLSRG
jgi:hypothetical protein